jgi:hypothetical protein
MVSLSQIGQHAPRLAAAFVALVVVFLLLRVTVQVALCGRALRARRRRQPQPPRQHLGGIPAD